MSPPVELENENMLIVDDLESSGTIKIMEHISGTLCMPIEADKIGDCTANVVFLAEIRVSVLPDAKDVKVDSILYEYGYDELIHILMQRVLFFADFYGYRVSILKLKKNHQSKKAFIAIGR